MADQTPALRRMFMFLGAGASKAASVPDTREMLKEFKASLKPDSDQAGALAKVEGSLVTWIAQMPAMRQLDVESVLESLAFLTGPKEVGAAFVQTPGGTPFAPFDVLAALRRELLAFIRARCLVEPSKVRPYDGFGRFFSDFDEIVAFTVNYDVVVEQISSSLGYQYSDGFRLRWDPRAFDDELAPFPRVSLYKLHGSAIWFKSPSLGHLSMPIKQANVRLIDETDAEPLIMYPAQKWEYERPFHELLGTFLQTLCSPECEWLVVVGYSFRDEHLNRVFRDAFTRNRMLVVILISPDSERIYTDLLSSPAFGWRTELDTNASNFPPSPLLGRVVRIPFGYERVLTDFARERFTSIRQALSAYLEARSKAEKDRNTNWQYIALRLIEEGFIELAADVEATQKGIPTTDTWRLQYELTKSVALFAVGIVTEARISWQNAKTILSQWLSSSLTIALQQLPPSFSLGFTAESIDPSGKLSKGNNAMLNIQSYLGRSKTMLDQCVSYIDAQDPRFNWFKELQSSLDRIEEYSRTAQSGFQIGEWVRSRKEAGLSDVSPMLMLVDQWLKVSTVGTPDSIAQGTNLRGAIEQLIQRTETEYSRRFLLPQWDP